MLFKKKKKVHYCMPAIEYLLEKYSPGKFDLAYKMAHLLLFTNVSVISLGQACKWLVYENVCR